MRIKLKNPKKRNRTRCNQDQEMRKSSGRGGLREKEATAGGTVAARLLGSPASGGSAGVESGWGGSGPVSTGNGEDGSGSGGLGELSSKKFNVFLGAASSASQRQARRPPAASAVR